MSKRLVNPLILSGKIDNSQKDKEIAREALSSALWSSC